MKKELLGDQGKSFGTLITDKKLIYHAIKEDISEIRTTKKSFMIAP